MRRVVIALILSIAAVAPGIAWRAEQDRELPNNWRRDRDQATSIERNERLRQSGWARARSLGFESVGACQPSFGDDISQLLYNAPGNGWVVVSHDCSDEPGCDDFFIVSCSQGSRVQASFCSNGGEAFWNTNLSVWDGGNLELCEDDTCGQQSEIFYPYVGNFYHRVRIGGTNDASGSYSLAVNIPANCFVGGPIGVDLQGFEVL